MGRFTDAQIAYAYAQKIAWDMGFEGPAETAEVDCEGCGWPTRLLDGPRCGVCRELHELSTLGTPENKEE